MKSKGSDDGDDRDGPFGLPVRLADHKPGVDHGKPAPEGESGGDHRFRRSEPKDIPKESLAERISKSRKGK